MGIVGGAAADWFLNRFYETGRDTPMGGVDGTSAPGSSKLRRMFGAGVFDELRGKTVIDFGCGGGENSIEMAQNGCAKVIGLEIQQEYIEKARREAERLGLAGRCVFSTDWGEPVDVIVSTDAFEHFGDPAHILELMRKLVKKNGYLLIEFGPTWYHPHGGHLFSVFPWAHLVFTEEALTRWRRGFKTDGATRFSEVAGGLNQMSIGRWEQLVAASGFEFLTYELTPIRAVKPLHNRWTREFFTAIVRARLRPV